jgi:hypothetical protein
MLVFLVYGLSGDIIRVWCCMGPRASTGSSDAPLARDISKPGPRPWTLVGSIESTDSGKALAPRDLERGTPRPSTSGHGLRRRLAVLVGPALGAREPAARGPPAAAAAARGAAAGVGARVADAGRGQGLGPVVLSVCLPYLYPLRFCRVSAAICTPCSFVRHFCTLHISSHNYEAWRCPSFPCEVRHASCRQRWSRCRHSFACSCTCPITVLTFSRL